MRACSVKCLPRVDFAASLYRIPLNRIARLELGLLFGVSSAIGKHDRDPRHPDGGDKSGYPQR